MTSPWAPTLSTIARRLGRPVVAVPTATGRALGSVARRFHLRSMSDDQIDYLMWGRCLGTSRMRTRLGVEPSWSTGAVVDEFARGLGASGIGPVPVMRGAVRLADTVSGFGAVLRPAFDGDAAALRLVIVSIAIAMAALIVKQIAAPKAAPQVAAPIAS